VLVLVGECIVGIDSLAPEYTTLGVADGHDDRALLVKQTGRHGANVAKTLHGHAGATDFVHAGYDAELQQAFGRVQAASSRGLTAAE